MMAAETQIQSTAVLKNRFCDLISEIETLLSEMNERAHTDHLTKLSRREVLESKVMDDFSKGKKGALLIIDVDHFKAVNDTHGHHKGDEVLKGVSKRILEVVSSHSEDKGGPLVARLGGEEFGIWFPGVCDRTVQVQAEKLRAHVEKSSIAEVQVTVSVGWSRKGSGWTECYLNADKALYQAKETGRNRVVKL